MASRGTIFLLGLAAVVIGTIQLGATLVAAARTRVLTVIAALRLYVCGSLFVVGVLVLVNLWRDHKKGL